MFKQIKNEKDDSYLTQEDRLLFVYPVISFNYVSGTLASGFISNK